MNESIKAVVDALGVAPFCYCETGVIYHADCRELLPKIPKEKINLVLTRPPYNVNFTYDQSAGIGLTEETYVEMLAEFQYPYRTVMIHHAIETIQYLGPAMGIPDTVLFWGNNGSMILKTRLINFYNCHPEFTPNRDYLLDIWMDNEKDVPTELMVKILEMVTKAGDTVFDPFFSNGAVIKAALQTGRNFIGIEVNKNKCQTMANYVENGMIKFFKDKSQC